MQLLAVVEETNIIPKLIWPHKAIAFFFFLHLKEKQNFGD